MSCCLGRAMMRPGRDVRTGGALALLALLVSGCVGPATTDGPSLLDDAGRAVPVGDLSRIVVTSVDVAEVFLLLGHGHRLAGVPDWIMSSSGCVSALPGAEALPRIGRPVVIDAEEVLARRPSLVIDKPFPLSPAGLGDRLDAVGVPVFRLDATESWDNVRHTIETIGRILSRVDATAAENATRLWQEVDGSMTAVQEALAVHDAGNGTRPLRSLYQLPAGLVAAAGTSASLLLEHAGAADIATEAGLKGYRQLSAEVIAARDPERLVVSCTAGSSTLLGAPRFAGSTAARIGTEAVFVADPAISALVGPRFPEGVRAVAEWLHPAAFGLIVPAVDVTWEEDTLVVDAGASSASDGPLRFRLDPGDGSAIVDSPDGTFRHHVTDQKAYPPTLLLIDPQGRIHTQRIDPAATR